MADAIITTTTTVFDFGCGRGSDIRHLRDDGVSSNGWDPEHAQQEPLLSADVVNLGYVVNVIENEGERGEALIGAWRLTRRVLVVAARMKFETLGQVLAPYADGYLTTRGTFQKFYDHAELRDWITEVLAVAPVAAAPGIFYVFRNTTERESFLANRQRRVAPVLHARRPEVLVERHRELFDAVVPFFATRGRLPSVIEVPPAAGLYRVVPGVETLLAALRTAVGEAAFDAVVSARRQDLLVYLALARFDGRPPLRRLSSDVQLDVRSFFPTYEAACQAADDVLLAVGQRPALEKAFAATEVGKLTGNALYVHVSAITSLPLLLRVYEGCAKEYVSAVDGATLVKLHRAEVKVSYLSYPDFDRVAHPALTGALVVHLKKRQVKYLDYTTAPDPSILHRKELFVGQDYPKRRLFERLTRQEERLGLLDEPATIGAWSRWQARLETLQVRIIGHRVNRGTSGAS